MVARKRTHKPDQSDCALRVPPVFLIRADKDELAQGQARR
jgi:hypothetical protein